MKQNRSQGGYILPMTVLLLASALLWGSTLFLTLSDQYAASDAMVKQEQSRLLAKSGWNLALKQLDENGSLGAIQLEKTSGCADIVFKMEEENLVHIVSSAESDEYPSVVEGTVYLLQLPWVETAEWIMTESLQSLKQPGIYCSREDRMVLNTSVTQSLALTSTKNSDFTVSIREPIRCTELYVHGDLIMEEDAFLEADAVYVSGQITGNNRISGSVVQEAYTSGLDYHVQVVERLM